MGKILILSNFDVGLYNFRKELISELLKHNEVYISLPYGELVEPLKAMGCKFVDTPVDRRGINPLRDFVLLRRYSKLMRELEPNLVITYTIKPNIYGGLVAKRKKIPYAVNVTGLGTAFQRDNFIRKLIVFLYKFALKKAKVVFFENEGNRQIFIKEKIVKESQTYRLNGAGVNLEKYQVAPYPGGEKIKFLFIGRIMAEKGIDELFEAMQYLVSDGIRCELHLLGIYEENYQEKIDKYEADGWLHYHGYQKDVRSFIKESHCFVLPSWHEGMANTNLECAAMGRPVITSNIHGCMEAVEDGVSGFLCEKQAAQDLYRVMKQFAKLSYDQRKEMGLAGRKHMENLFDKRVVVRETIEAIGLR